MARSDAPIYETEILGKQDLGETGTLGKWKSGRAKAKGGDMNAFPQTDLELKDPESGSGLMRVLIAEDDTATRLLLQQWVREFGFDPVLAVDGEEAWGLLRQGDAPRLLVVDWQMPRLDGVNLIRRIRFAANQSCYPFILMTSSRSDPESVIEVLEAGADQFLAKPFEKMQLRARLAVGARIVAMQEKLMQKNDALRVQAAKDPLTGLLNRAEFLDLFKKELSRAGRAKQQTGLMILDVDHFKGVNDSHGHLVGDMVLQEIAQRLYRGVRSYDFVGRYGGEEFFIFLSNCGRSALWNRAEQIRESICAEPIQVGDLDIQVSVSIGAAVARPGERSSLEVLAAADSALYKAKRTGRNRTVYCSEAEISLALDTTSAPRSILKTPELMRGLDLVPGSFPARTLRGGTKNQDRSAFS
jgi:diguanylate cyclase (GGDEF)-like protein